MPTPATVREFEQALSRLRLPTRRQSNFLRAHAQAKGRALNMRTLARKAPYRSYRGVNLQYGLLAKRVGRELRRTSEGFGLLVEFVPPKGKSLDHISNAEWILIMRPQFAKALRKAGWI